MDYNLRSPAVRRLLKEALELKDPVEDYYAQPLEDNIFEWHFTIRGPPNSDYEGGVYHGRITLPPDYPMKPPSIILLTPNGRFEINRKICLSISGHHPESWQPSWSIRTALLAIIGFMPTHGNGAIGSLEYSPEERQDLALRSQNWVCLECGHIKDLLAESTPEYMQGMLDENLPQVIGEGASNSLDTLKTKDTQSCSVVNENEAKDEESYSKRLIECEKDESCSGSFTQDVQTQKGYVSKKSELLDQQCLTEQSLQTVELTNISEKRAMNTMETAEADGYWSLVAIWMIVITLIFLVARRVFIEFDIF